MLAEDFSLAKKELAGIELVQASPSAAARELCRMAKCTAELGGKGFHLVNAYTISLAARDPLYSELLKSSTANFPDGKPLTWWKHADSTRLQQIRGPQLFEDVMSMGRATNVRHYLLGSSPGTLVMLQDRLRSLFPEVEIVGSYSPPFRQLTDDEIVRQDGAILESGAEIVWVGLGTPKQDWEVQRLATALPVVAVAVGAAFDFTAGTKRNAPEIISKLGLEWLFRFANEPRRLWKRYLIGNFIFLRHILVHRPRWRRI